jgi:hypothetical protein
VATEPIAGKKILDNYHAASNHHGIGDAQNVVTGQAIAAEDKAADDGLEQIVG